MGTTYNLGRAAADPLFVVTLMVARYGLTGGLSVPLVPEGIATASWVWLLPETRGIVLPRLFMPPPGKSPARHSRRSAVSADGEKGAGRRSYSRGIGFAGGAGGGRRAGHSQTRNGIGSGAGIAGRRRQAEAVPGAVPSRRTRRASVIPGGGSTSPVPGAGPMPGGGGIGAPGIGAAPPAA